MGLLGFISGVLIVVCFVGCAQFLRANTEGRTYDKETMSAIAADPRYTNGVRFFCWMVSLLTIPYVYSLIQVFDLPLTSTTVLISIPASIGLFFTALTINAPDGHLHNIASFVFYFSLWLMPIDLATRLASSDRYSVIGGYSILVALAGVLTIITGYFLRKGKEKGTNGIAEVIFMAGNAYWVIIYTLLMLVY